MKSIQPVTMQDPRHQTDFLACPLLVAGTGFHGEVFIREQHFQRQAPDLVNISVIFSSFPQSLLMDLHFNWQTNVTKKKL